MKLLSSAVLKSHKLSALNMLSWLFTAHVSLVCSSSFFHFGHSSALRGCNLCADLHMCVYRAPWELEIWQCFSELWLAGVIFSLALWVASFQCNLGLEESKSKSWQRIRQRQHECLEMVKSKWRDILIAFLFTCISGYNMILRVWHHIRERMLKWDFQEIKSLSYTHPLYSQREWVDGQRSYQEVNFLSFRCSVLKHEAATVRSSTLPLKAQAGSFFVVISQKSHNNASAYCNSGGLKEH